jgi:hypothetical protein
MLMYFRHFSFSGVPTVESFLLACLFYFIAERRRVR